MSNKAKYLLKVWNGKYGNSARFVVYDTVAEKYGEYTPSRPNDIAWVKDDLTKQDEYKSWESFEDEPVEDLKNIVF